MMLSPDERAFFAERSTLPVGDHLFLTYRFECVGSPDSAAAHLCREMSTAQWRRVGRDEDFRPRHGAKVVDLRLLGESPRSRMDPPWFPGERYHDCEVVIALPHLNFGTRLPNFLTAACGEGAFHSPAINAIKWMDVEFPDGWLDGFEGPQFGIDGVRADLGIPDRPLFLGVVKPNVGLAPEDFVELAYESWLGGLDAPKDDEMLADVAYSPIAVRAGLLAERKKRAEDATGTRKWFILNVTDEVDRLREHHDLAARLDLGAVMMNGFAVGLSGVRMLRKHAQVPLVGHFDLMAPMGRVPHFGVAAPVLTTLQRLAGFDLVILPGFGARMQSPDAEVMANARACRRPLGRMRPALPVPGGSDWAGSLPGMLDRLGTRDFGMVPGRGVFGHPDGPRAGARSMLDAWEAVSRGIPLAEWARERPALAAALRCFGAGEPRGA